jgi:WD40 repeat protein
VQIKILQINTVQKNAVQKNAVHFVLGFLVLGLTFSGWANQAVAGDETKILKGHSAGVIAVAFSPDGRSLASASVGDTIKLWDVKSGALRRTLYGNSGDISAIAFSGDGQILATGGDNGEVTLWELAAGRACAAPSGDAAKVMGVAFAPHDAWLAAEGADRTIRLWDPKTGKLKTTLQGHARAVLCASFSSDGKTLASGSVDGTVRVWNVERECEATSVPLRERARRGPVVSLDFSPDGRDLAIATREVVEVWDVVRSERRSELANRPKGSFWWAAHYSTQGTLIAIGSGARYERAIRVSSKKGVSTGSFRPEDRVVRVWDAKTGKEIARLAGHHDSVRAVALSPDGTVLASGSRDKTVRLWALSHNRSPIEQPPVSQVAASNGVGATAPRLEDEIVAADANPTSSPSHDASSRVECLKELELLSSSATLDKSAELESAGGEQSDPWGTENSGGTSDGSSPLLSDALSLALDKLIKEPNAATPGESKKVSSDFAGPFRFDPKSSPTKSLTGQSGEHVDAFSINSSGASSGGKTGSSWEVFRSAPSQGFGHASGGASWSGTASSTHGGSETFHYDGGHGGGSSGGGRGGDDHHKK